LCNVSEMSTGAEQGNACMRPGQQVRRGSLARQLPAHIITHCKLISLVLYVFLAFFQLFYSKATKQREQVPNCYKTED